MANEKNNNDIAGIQMPRENYDSENMIRSSNALSKNEVFGQTRPKKASANTL